MRRKDREVSRIEDILQIVDKAKVLHLGLSDGVYPYVVPLHYGYTYNLKDDRFVFYMHCAKDGRKLDLIRKNPHVCIEFECDIVPVSGGDIACMYGSEYASVIAKGEAELVSNTAEKITGLKCLMKNQTGRDFAMDERMADSVEVIRVYTSNYSAKARKKKAAV